MRTKRRGFLKSLAFLGAGATTGVGLAGCRGSHSSGAQEGSSSLAAIKKAAEKEHKQRFNMSGYAAPKISTVRIGFAGIGMRGTEAVYRMSHIEGVEIKALCDKYPDRVEQGQKQLVKFGHPKADKYSGEEGWKKMCEREDIDLIYIATPWDLHTPIAVYAMEQGKHVATEVPAAITVEEAWQLVETSEYTKKHCMMLENCCYDFFEALTLNLVRQGYFGELVHAEGAYIHDLRSLNFSKKGYADMWRLRENMRNGNLYPTHGLGPICQCLNINREDKMDYLTSMQSADFQMGRIAKELAAEDEFFKPFEGKDYRGNMNTSLVRTAHGKTIMIQHDVTSPRPYSRIHLLSGTEGMARKWPLPGRIAQGHSWLKDEEMNKLQKEYAPELLKHVGKIAKKIGGHGGMDFIMDWRLIDCLRNGLALDQDVYDAASWSVIAPLSEWSVANRSDSIAVPDFTCGSWKRNRPVDLSLRGGGSTMTRAKKG